MHRLLADDTPDRKGVSVVSIEAAATVDVHGDGRDLCARDTNRLNSDASFPLTIPIAWTPTPRS